MDSSIVPMLSVPPAEALPASRFAATPARATPLDRHAAEAHSHPSPAYLMDSPLPQEASGAPPPLSPEEQQRRWFAAEVLPHEPALRSWLKARYPTLSENDDVVQETYARLLRTGSGGRIANARSYLFTTARNLVVDLFRRRQAAPLVSVAEAERTAVAEERSNVADAVSSAQELEVLRGAIAALPDRCRTIMVLQKLHGLSNAEIAAQLGLSIHTVNAQLVIGLARCRAYLAARGILRGSHR